MIEMIQKIEVIKMIKMTKTCKKQNTSTLLDYIFHTPETADTDSLHERYRDTDSCSQKNDLMYASLQMKPVQW